MTGARDHVTGFNVDCRPRARSSYRAWTLSLTLHRRTAR